MSEFVDKTYIIKTIDCKYLIFEGIDKKNTLQLRCRLKQHKVSEQSCKKCEKRVFLKQMSIDNENDW